MAFYVFLTSRFIPEADASGICTYNVAKALMQNGHEVCCICEGDKNGLRTKEGIQIYDLRQTPMSYFKKKAEKTRKKKDILAARIYGFFRKCMQGVCWFHFPNVSPVRAKKAYKILEKIQKNQKIDVIVGGFRPYESIAAMHMFKKKHPESKTVACFWDLLRAKNPFGKPFQPVFDRLCEKAEKQVFKVNDRILFPKSGKATYQRDVFSFAKEKTVYFDFPVFTEFEKQTGKEKTDETIRIYCIGSTDGANRSAAYFLKIADVLQKTIDIEVHFVGPFSDMELYRAYENVPYVYFHGQVPFDAVPGYMQEADVLLNFGNKITYSMIPSKIFQYFSACKPILNIVAHAEDAALPYFEKYPAVCNIEEYMPEITRDTEKIKQFLIKARTTLPSRELVNSLYEESSPAYFAKLLTEGL